MVYKNMICALRVIKGQILTSNVGPRAERVNECVIVCEYKSVWHRKGGGLTNLVRGR